MRLNGAQMVWESLSREGVEVFFGITGGKVIPLYHELTNYPIRQVTVRHEQAAAHAADGYARATGKVGVCVSTSGPGATNLVTGIANAHMDSVPIVAITGQASSADLGMDSFQEVDITGITMPIVKHNYLITDIADLPRAIKEAFHIARNGRPGPVLVDIAVNVQTAKAEYVYPDEVELPGFRPHLTGNRRQLRQAARMIAEAKQPLLIAGRGVIIARAWDLLRELAETSDVPVATTLLGKSALPETHPLCLGMGGMHGESFVNQALQRADLILAIGNRFDDRFTSTAGSFAPNAKIIHVDIDPAEIGKRIRVDLPIVGDALRVLQDLVPMVEPAEHKEWKALIDNWRQDTHQRDVVNRDPHALLPQHVIRMIHRATNGQAIMVSDVGQNQMWEAQYYHHLRPGGLITSGGLGTMGFGLPAAVGAAVGCPNEQVWVVAGDGGFQMTSQELVTAVQERLPIKIALLNNGYLGMVRQWQELFFEANYSGTPILGPDFAKLAEACGVMGLTVDDHEGIAPAIERAMAHEGPVLIDFHIEREQNVFPMVPVGGAIHEMIRRPSAKPETPAADGSQTLHGEV
jgi:acetolactate synthase I/II/III large subunit